MNNELLANPDRAAKIIELVRKNTSVSVHSLSELFQVSGTTIRTDLKRLEETGKIVRTHGGAMLRSSIIRETDIKEREAYEEKALIAKAAVQLTENGETILIDTGTSMTAFANALICSSLKNLRIFTIDLGVANILENSASFEIHLIGGKIRNGFHYCYGHRVIEELKQYNFEKLFLATSAIDSAHGLTTSNSDLAELKAAMLNASREIILLADSSKFGRVDFQKFADTNDIDTLITDVKATPGNIAAFKEQISDIILAS